MTRKCRICGETVEHVDEVERHLSKHSWAERELELMPEVEEDTTAKFIGM